MLEITTRYLNRGLTAALILSALGCGDDPATSMKRRTTSTPTLNSLVISAESNTLEVNGTRSLTATGQYSDGSTVDVSTEASWNSSMSSVATVDLIGNITGVALGISTISASYEGVVGNIDITVTNEPRGNEASLSLSPDPVMLEVGDSQQFQATLTDTDDAMTDISARITWQVADTTIANLNPSSPGLLTAVMAGQTTLSGTDMETGLSAQATITVSGSNLDRIEIVPNGATIPLGTNGRFTAEAVFTDGSRVEVTEMVTWSSSSTTTAQVSNQAGQRGSITTSAIGITSITALHDQSQQTTTVTLTVTNPNVVSIRIEPPTATAGIGRNQLFTATAVYSDGSLIDVSRRVTWSSSMPMVTSVSNMPGTVGVANALSVGTATISALHVPSGVSSDDSNTSAILTVLPAVLTSIAVTPLQASVALGASQNFVATGLYSSGPSRDISSEVNWQSSDPMVASVTTGTSNPGLSQSLSQGQTTIIAVDPVTGISSEDAMRSAVLTVNPPTLTNIEIRPGTASLVVMGQQQFQAIAHYSDGTQQDVSRLRTTSWLTTSSNVVSVNAFGLASANSVGNVTISARDTRSNINSDDSNESASVTVATAMLTSISVTPTSTVVPVGVATELVATATYNNGATANISESVTWNSSDTNVATVSNTAGTRGIVTSVAAGGASISATEPGSGISSDNSGRSADITVNNLSITALEIGPSRPSALGVGDTQDFWSRATFSDGSQFDVTNSVSWLSSRPTIAQFGAGMNGPGVVEAVSIGQTNISAQAPIPSAVTSNVVPLSVSTSYIFSDDFEDGDFSDWSGPGTGFSIDTTQGANGTSRSLTVGMNGATGHFNGVHYQFPSAQPSELSVYLKTDTVNSNGYVILGDNRSSSNYGAIFFHFASSNTMYLYAGSRRYGSSNYQANTWYHLEFKNINWAARTLSFHVNGNLIEAGIPFRAPSSSATRLSFYNYSTANTWWDEIILR